MKHISSETSNRLLAGFMIRALLTTAAAVLLLSYLCSQIILKLDLSLDLIRYIAIGIDAVAASCISLVSVCKFRNNGAIMGILSCIPMIIWSIINTVTGHLSLPLLLIKTVLIIVISALCGIFISKKSRRIKV